MYMTTPALMHMYTDKVLFDHAYTFMYTCLYMRIKIYERSNMRNNVYIFTGVC